MALSKAALAGGDAISINPVLLAPMTPDVASISTTNSIWLMLGFSGLIIYQRRRFFINSPKLIMPGVTAPREGLKILENMLGHPGIEKRNLWVAKTD